MTELLLVALGGALGACARLWVGALVASRLGEAFPWGTLVVNATGAFAIGVVAATLPEGRAWLGLVVGALGSYTTVSSFSLQTIELAGRGAMAAAAGNVLLSLALCLGGARAGMAIGGLVAGGGG